MPAAPAADPRPSPRSGPDAGAPVFRVALPLPIDGLFDYLPPASAGVDAGWVGCRVQVPFGPRRLIGWVAATGIAEGDPERLRRIEARIDPEPLLPAELWRTLQWAAGYYHHPLGEVLNAAVPAALRAGRGEAAPRPEAWRLTDAGRAGIERLRSGSRPQRLAEWLLQHGPATPEALDRVLPGWRDAARRLRARDFAETVVVEAQRQPPLPVLAAPPLNEEQSRAVAAVREVEGFGSLLLDGVTGSGKTEVYLAAIADCLARGRQALVLVPEIGLTPQTLRRFRERLPVPVLAYHSALADGERAQAWEAMRRGEARVLIGTRSAAFMPLAAPGLIVVDEEHDASYKQHEGFRYHARDLAMVRGKALSVPVLLGSATPALETLRHAAEGRYRTLRLRHRATGAQAPRVRIVDLRGRRLDDGLSPEMLDGIAACLARGEQALVFRNRRGYAPVLLCHDCSWHARCRRCEAALTVHGRGRSLQCHHCGARQPAPPACPDCGGLALQPQGAGTERLEQALGLRFPDANLVRIDRGTTQRRDALARHFERLGDGPGILVGTQMLAKGHDLPRLTLVCVVGVDEGLFSADFRAPERLAQLLIQVSGRAGRGERAGEVLLQTHQPEHPLLTTLLSGGYHAFAGLALAERAMAQLPPYTHLALLRAEAVKAAELDAFLASARQLCATPPGVAVHGPLPAPMPLRQGRLRGQLLLSAGERMPLHACLRAWLPQLRQHRDSRKVRWSIDVDPADLY